MSPSAGGGDKAADGANHIRDTLIDLLGGVNAGITCVYVGQPLDTVKVKMQTFPTLYRSAVHCFTETFRANGIRGLYAGTSPALIANVAENAILFCGYGACQKAVGAIVGKRDILELSPVENALAGAGGAFFASFALCPTELVKCRLQALREMRDAHPEKKIQLVGPLAMTKQILRSEGARGLFHGLSPTLMREVPGYFTFFFGYDFCRRMLTPDGASKDEIGALRTILCGGVGGMTLWTLMFPFDVVKSRVQVAGSDASMFATMISIAKNEGIAALYTGLPPTLVRTFFASGALFVAYEYTRKAMHTWCDA